MDYGNEFACAKYPPTQPSPTVARNAHPPTIGEARAGIQGIAVDAANSTSPTLRHVCGRSAASLQWLWVMEFRLGHGWSRDARRGSHFPPARFRLFHCRSFRTNCRLAIQSGGMVRLGSTYDGLLAGGCPFTGITSPSGAAKGPNLPIPQLAPRSTTLQSDAHSPQVPTRTQSEPAFFTLSRLTLMTGGCLWDPFEPVTRAKAWPQCSFGWAEANLWANHLLAHQNGGCCSI